MLLVLLQWRPPLQALLRHFSNSPSSNPSTRHHPRTSPLTNHTRLPLEAVLVLWGLAVQQHVMLPLPTAPVSAAQISTATQRDGGHTHDEQTPVSGAREGEESRTRARHTAPLTAHTPEPAFILLQQLLRHIATLPASQLQPTSALSATLLQALRWLLQSHRADVRRAAAKCVHSSTALRALVVASSPTSTVSTNNSSSERTEQVRTAASPVAQHNSGLACVRAEIRVVLQQLGYQPLDLAATQRALLCAGGVAGGQERDAVAAARQLLPFPCQGLLLVPFTPQQQQQEAESDHSQGTQDGAAATTAHTYTRGDSEPPLRTRGIAVIIAPPSAFAFSQSASHSGAATVAGGSKGSSSVLRRGSSRRVGSRMGVKSIGDVSQSSFSSSGVLEPLGPLFTTSALLGDDGWAKVRDVCVPFCVSIIMICLSLTAWMSIKTRHTHTTGLHQRSLSSSKLASHLAHHTDAGRGAACRNVGVCERGTTREAEVSAGAADEALWRACSLEMIGVDLGQSVVNP